MRAPLALLTLCLFAASVATDAQHFDGDYIAGYNQIVSVSGAGAVTTLVPFANGARGLAMDADNRDLVYGDAFLRSLMRADPATGAVTTMVTDMNIFWNTSGISLDQDGNLVVAATTSTGVNGLFKVEGRTITTLISTVTMGVNSYVTGRLIRDVDNGNFIMLTEDALGRVTLYSVRDDGASFTTVRSTFPKGYPSQGLAQDTVTGDLLLGGFDFPPRSFLLRVKKTGASTIAAEVPFDSSAFRAPIADRASAASPRLVSVGTSYRYHTDLTTGAVTSLALVTGPSGVSALGATILHRRNIQTVRTAPRTWEIRLSFPTRPYKVYALIAGLSGVRPGVALPDGRRLLLNTDILTILTLVDAALPIFDDGGNRLDRRGRATGKLDLTSLPPLGGLTLHMVALVESSPGNIAVITDPYVMRLP